MPVETLSMKKSSCAVCKKKSGCAACKVSQSAVTETPDSALAKASAATPKKEEPGADKKLGSGFSKKVASAVAMKKAFDASKKPKPAPNKKKENTSVDTPESVLAKEFEPTSTEKLPSKEPETTPLKTAHIAHTKKTETPSTTNPIAGPSKQGGPGSTKKHEVNIAEMHNHTTNNEPVSTFLKQSETSVFVPVAGGMGATNSAKATNGTTGTPFQVTPLIASVEWYHSISAQPGYQSKSFEELRLEDYKRESPYDKVGDLQLTEQEQEFKQKVDKHVEAHPRFLFRYWTPASGGDKRLNTQEAVTPRAFLNGNGPKSLYKMQPTSVKRLAKMHVDCEVDSETVFSSWTQLFTKALRWGIDSESVHTNAHICILDTAKLPTSNVILHTKNLSDLFGQTIEYFDYEYLVFGIVQGAAYKAVPLESFPSLTSLHQGTCDLTKTLELAQIFGGELAAPIAAQMMACTTSRSEQTCDMLLSAFARSLIIPLHWTIDKSIMEPNVVYHDYQDPERADILLRRMVEKKYNRPIFKEAKEEEQKGPGQEVVYKGRK